MNVLGQDAVTSRPVHSRATYLVHHAAALRFDADLSKRLAARLPAVIDPVTRRMLAPLAVPRRGITLGGECEAADMRLLRRTGP